jgi:hypothetical protein
MWVLGKEEVCGRLQDAIEVSLAQICEPQYIDG